jgi:hypothetical protein
MIRGNSAVVATLAAFSLLAIMVMCTLSVSADPIGPTQSPDTTFRLREPLPGIAWLFFLNVLINLFCFSALLLAFSRKYVSMSGIVKTSGLRFLAALICAAIVISLIGAVVDFYLVTQPRLINGYFEDRTEGIYRVVVLDVVNWIAALSVIFLSVIASSWSFLRLRLPVSLMIAYGFVMINIYFWILIGVFGEDVTFLTILFSVLSTPIVVRGLVRWYSEERALQTESMLGPQERRALPDQRLSGPQLSRLGVREGFVERKGRQ